MRDALFVTLTKRWLRALFWLAFRIEYHGRHHIPATGPALIVSNHQSYLDPLFVGAALPRSVRYMAMRQLFVKRPIEILLRFYGAFPVATRKADTGAIKACLHYLDANELVLIFPEGERSPDGRLLEFFHGFARIAQLREVRIVPVTIDGAVRVWPRSARWPRPAKVQVTFHAPLQPSAVASDGAVDAERISMHVRDVMETALEMPSALSPPTLRR
jgi:1-acyl-sn-glycerol-3-phosphate acyltransferase